MLKESLEKKLAETFSPVFAEVVNESYMHNVPKGSESHFKVTIVSEDFEGQRLITRHRAVNALFAEELNTQIHALAIHTYSPSEWDKEHQSSPDSPMCMGGNKK
ncbi:MULTISPECIES: BolA family protein [Vibrio]|uniref:DNA-binding transcriptional regulator BolA n=2 Tax=Vibrio genomosp. F10 TaxID=723171 RepID=A0A1B9QXZ2_9VIBR|nr:MULTISPECIES: BolA/IbaG family iron-sulfur metabolism protein [Vibrio]OCH75175.1 transcriptional regulator BolA [Vibrio genomosp. F10]OEE38385.1 transcriptional regulator BolA [Vibrio genomosp. F10 str. ZF-129]OEE98287.1 transcriptional regulator BolA [Vibrio genomosp. F10 str. 9ZC157]OEF04658.1 transcriptional regulator BolA [Vibrio genomosp. F10 str. 9ZD137]OEF09107.1 transcriptional regulator BolA [Vibrio genomosp. F10 str. 9ZB36]